MNIWTQDVSKSNAEFCKNDRMNKHFPFQTLDESLRFSAKGQNVNFGLNISHKLTARFPLNLLSTLMLQGG